MRLRAFAAILISLTGGALAASPEEEYWRAKLEATAKLRALVAEKADEGVLEQVEKTALDALKRQLVEIVGPVKVEGRDKVVSNVTALRDSPDFGRLDGVSLEGASGRVVVTTDKLLRHWLADFANLRPYSVSGQPQKPRPAWASSVKSALLRDDMYGVAFGEDGFLTVAEIKLPTPDGASLAIARLGRWTAQDNTAPYPVLIVTVMKGRRVLIALGALKTKAPEIPACTTLAASMEPAHPDAPSWGPSDVGEAFEAWRKCERRGLPEQPDFGQVKREAREISERLARAK